MRLHRFAATFFLLCACLASALPGQTLLARHAGWPTMTETQAPVAIPPWPTIPAYPPLQVSNPPPLTEWTPPPAASSAQLAPPTPFPFGDLAFDNLGGNIVETDGDFIAVHTHETYLATPGLPTVNLTAQRPVFLGRLTGIAVAVATQRIWVTDGVAVQSVLLTAPSIAASFPVAFGFALVTPPMTGLDWDPVLGHLVGCDAGGNVYRFTTWGAAVGPQPWLAVPPGMSDPATDVAVPHVPLGTGSVDAVVQFAGFGLWAHSNDGGSWSGWSYASDGPIPPSGTEAGLALHYGVERISDGTRCGCLYGSFHVTAPSVVGQTAFGVALDGVAPGVPVMLLVDPASNSSAPFGYSDCFGALRISPQPSMLLVGAGDAAGNATFPIPLAVPASLAAMTFYAQAGFLCGTATTTFSMTRVIQLQLGLP